MRINNRLKIALSIGLIIVVGFISNSWVLSPDNFYYADDWGWLLYSKYNNLLSYLRIVPMQMYNDRPIGQLFFKLLFLVFGYNYIAQHAVLLFIHIINGIMVFFLSLSLPLFKKKIPGSLIAAIIFVGWQGANFAVQWNAAVFDLLSIFFVITFLIATIKYIHTEKAIFIFFSCLTYFIALRTKESNLFLPYVAMALTIFVYKKPWKWLIKFTPLILMWLVYTIVLMTLALSTNFQGLNEVAAYQSSFSPFIILRNIFRYTMLYFDITNSYQTYQRNIWLTVIVGVFVLAYGYFLFYRKRQDLPVVVFFAASIVMCLLPVLPLVYSSLRLYLYVPSIFFSLYLTFLTFQISKRHHLNIVIWLVVILYINLFNQGTIITRDSWLSTGRENRIAYENTKKLSIPVETNKIEIINVKKPTNLFQFGKGDVLRLLLNNKNIEINVYPDDKERDQRFYLLDYSKVSGK